MDYLWADCRLNLLVDKRVGSLRDQPHQWGDSSPYWTCHRVLNSLKSWLVFTFTNRGFSPSEWLNHCPTCAFFQLLLNWNTFYGRCIDRAFACEGLRIDWALDVDVSLRPLRHGDSVVAEKWRTEFYGRCGADIVRRDEPSRAFRKLTQTSMWNPLSQLMYAWWQCHGYEFIYLECHTWRAAWYRISLGCEITILSSIEAASGWTNLTSDIWLSWTERYFGEPTPSRGHTCELSCSNSAHQIVGLKPFWYQNGP